MAIKTLKEAIESLDLAEIETGKITDIYKEGENALQKVTLTVTRELKEEAEMREKAERWGKHWTNIIEGWLELADISDVEAVVDDVKTNIDALINAKK